MEFIWPLMLWLLLVIPVFVLLYVRLDRNRQRAASIFNTVGFGQTVARSRRRFVPAAIFLISLIILILSLARPETTVSLPRIEGTVILAFDVSGSMAAEDIEPTRLEAAKAAAREFVDRQPDTVLIGVVAFSRGALPVQIPTDDRDLVLAAIDRLESESGTSVGSGIQAALTAIDASQNPLPPPLQYSDMTPQPTPSPTPMPQGQYNSATIVLLTDGENTDEPDPMEIAQMAADRGVRIYTVGVGSPAGTTLEIDGFNVFTVLDETTLQQIALLTGGEYFNAQNEDDLQEIYETLEPEFVIKPEKMEVTALFAGAGLLLMLIGSTISLMWFGRMP